MEISKRLIEEFKLKKSQVENTIKLLDEGSTIPFIARYRKEMTGGLEDKVIRELSNRLEYLRNLEEKKEEVIRLIDEQGKLTEELKGEILSSETLQRIDDLYRPYRPKRRTRATIAKEKGLEALSIKVYNHEIQGKELEDEILSHMDEEKELLTREDVVNGVMDIIAEVVSDDANNRDFIRMIFMKKGFVFTEVTDKEKDEKSVYEMYYAFNEPIKSMANHRVLAINRAEKEKILRVKLELIEMDIVGDLIGKILIGVNSDKDTYRIVSDAIEDSYKRLLFPAIEREIRNDLTEKAEDEAISVFGLNLKPLIMQSPIKDKNIIAIDPGFRTGCKIAVIDSIGKLLDFTTVYPTAPHNKVEETKKILLKLVDKYDIDVFVIGNGTASRETEMLVSDMIKESKLDLAYSIVSEAGASIYSASEVGIDEFPDLDVSIRGAVSIGRRLQDPMAELVKIEPRHIGVGQYQHDLNQGKLDETLSAVVEDCVNSVGVNLNTASISLLSYVAGVSKRVAGNIIEYREEVGRFTTRNELKKVKGLGPKTYTQCAGFLRIQDGKNQLDNTGVHPESYDVALKVLEKNTFDFDIEKAAEELEVGIPTLTDIVLELKKPGRDPRDEAPKPILRQDVLKIEDLNEGMVIKGTIRNVVDFGAFVDIGVTQDGLVHISHLSDKFIKHPKEVVKVGDIVDVKILEVDLKRDRISLSMKDL